MNSNDTSLIEPETQQVALPSLSIKTGQLLVLLSVGWQFCLNRWSQTPEMPKKFGGKKRENHKSRATTFVCFCFLLFLFGKLGEAMIQLWWRDI